MQANYASICPDCKLEIVIGSNIERNKKGNWCPKGENCTLKDPDKTKKPEEIQQEQIDNFKKQQESQVNDQTAEITVKGIKKIVRACWKEAYDDGVTTMDGIEGPHDFKDTLILSEVFLKEYCAFYRTMMEQGLGKKK